MKQFHMNIVYGFNRYSQEENQLGGKDWQLLPLVESQTGEKEHYLLYASLDNP